MKIATLITAALLAGTAVGASAATITPAVEFASSSTLTDGSPYTLGYAFSLSGPVTVNALGYWNNGRQSNHQVGIWDLAGTLLVSTTVLGTDPVVGNFVWGEIANYTLAAGSYVIAGEFLGDGTFVDEATGIVSIPQYTYLGDRQVLGAGLNFPTETYGSYGSNGILEVSFSVAAVPEPASWAMMIAGFGLVGAVMRRRSAAVAA